MLDAIDGDGKNSTSPDRHTTRGHDADRLCDNSRKKSIGGFSLFGDFYGFWWFWSRPRVIGWVWLPVRAVSTAPQIPAATSRPLPGVEGDACRCWILAGETEFLPPPMDFWYQHQTPMVSMEGLCYTMYNL